MPQNPIHGIAIVGANGGGKTTLGQKLSELLGYKRMDVEDYYFKPSEIPYSNSRTREEVRELLLLDIKKHRRFVLSAVNGDFGEEINSLYDLIIYIHAPLNIRMERVKSRAFDKFGSRVLKGGDMYEQEQKFFDFVAARNTDGLDKWVETLKCPVIHLDGTKPIEENIAFLSEYLTK